MYYRDINQILTIYSTPLMALSRALAPNNPSVSPSHVAIVTVVTTVTLVTVITLLLSPAAVAPHSGVGSAPHSLVTMLALAEAETEAETEGGGGGRGRGGRGRAV